MTGDGRTVPGGAVPDGDTSGQGARPWLAAGWARTLSAGVVVLGSANIVFAVGLDIQTFFGGTGPSDEAVFAPFLLVFPLWVWVVLLDRALAAEVRRRRRYGAPRLADSFGELSPRVLIALGAAVLFGLICAAVGMPATAHGVPERDPSTGQYTLESHGSVRVVSLATYVQAVAGRNRLCLGVTILFSGVAVADALNHWLAQRRSTHP